MPAGLLAVAAVLARARGSCWWRPSEQQGKQGRPGRGCRRRRTPAGGIDGGRRQGGPTDAAAGDHLPHLLPTRAGKIPGGWTCCSRRAPSTSLSRCCLPVPECLTGRTRRIVELRWTTWRRLTCGSTLLRAAPMASPCLSTSSAMSYLSAIQLYTATSLTISRRSMGSAMDSWRGVGSRGSWWWPPAMPAGLQVVAAVLARGAPGGGRWPCLRGSRLWPPSLLAGLLVVAVRATRTTRAGRPCGSRRRRTPPGGSTEEGLVWWWPHQDAAAGDHLPDLLPTCAGNILGGWTCCSRRAPSTSLSRCCLPERLDGPDTEKSRAAVDYLALADLWEHFAESSAYGLAVLVRLLGHVLPLRHPAIHSHQPHHLQEEHGERNGFLHSIRNLSSYHIPVAAVYGSASA
ncbi:uncharacterized protein [Lolium perenne]|uniref:uncharacterized protein isoform X2 n=1 Tax=Lolium perenne TaxID=4522 RepID=UPI003A99D012